jgi:hypothetical protein
MQDKLNLGKSMQTAKAGQYHAHAIHNPADRHS